MRTYPEDFPLSAHAPMNMSYTPTRDRILNNVTAENDSSAQSGVQIGRHFARSGKKHPALAIVSGE